jgi:hypothetical protein
MDLWRAQPLRTSNCLELTARAQLGLCSVAVSLVVTLSSTVTYIRVQKCAPSASS